MLEQTLERIAIALEKIASTGVVTEETKKPVPTPPAKSEESAHSVEESPKVASVKKPPAPPVKKPVNPPETGSQAPTIDQVNKILIAEMARLGGREKIDEVLAEMGATGIKSLKPSQYAELIKNVQAITV